MQPASASSTSLSTLATVPLSAPTTNAPPHIVRLTARQQLILFAWDATLLGLLALSTATSALVLFIWCAILSTLSADQVLGLLGALGVSGLAVAWFRILLSLRTGAGRRLVFALVGVPVPASLATSTAPAPTSRPAGFGTVKLDLEDNNL